MVWRQIFCCHIVTKIFYCGVSDVRYKRNAPQSATDQAAAQGRGGRLREREHHRQSADQHHPNDPPTKLSFILFQQTAATRELASPNGSVIVIIDIIVLVRRKLAV